MEKYSIHLYPAELQLIQGGHSNARMTLVGALGVRRCIIVRTITGL
jgi:hypothetical protein